jgi:glycosyltransferase involved in cell wall biosynthesis
MACILKIPTNNTKGVIIFTSQERNKVIVRDKNLQKRISLLKDRWIFGTHHNWHDHKFLHDSLYDFEIAGDNYLKEVNKKEFTKLEISAANFVPDEFKYHDGNKFWDILYIGRAVPFKNIPDFFEVIRKLYDDGKKYRVLFIAPVPPSSTKMPKSNEIMDLYREKFSFDERQLFSVLAVDYDYPFPFDLDTLANFYRSSRVFLFCSHEEMRPRTVGYAIAAGLPIVVRQPISYLLPNSVRKEPHVYVAKQIEDFPSLINNALEYSKSPGFNELSMTPSITEFDYKISIQKMREFFVSHFNLDIYVDNQNSSLLYNLGIRIARHHGFGNTPNSMDWSLGSLFNYLERHSIEEMQANAEQSDVERYILKYSEYVELDDKTYRPSFMDRLRMLLRKLADLLIKTR